MRRFLRPTTSVLGLTCSLYFITYVDRVNVATAASSLKTDLALSNTELGLIFSAFALAYAVLMVPGGRLGDRLGPHLTLSISGLLWAGGTILTGLSAGFTSLFAARLLVGIGESAVPSTASRALMPWTPAVRRGFAQGMTHAFGRLGNAATPPFVAALILATSWRSAFVIQGCLSLAWVCLWAMTYRNDPRRHPRVTPEELAQLPADIGSRTKISLNWMKLLKTVFPATLASFCHGWTLWFFLNWIPLYFANNYNMDLRSSAFFASGVFFSGTVGTILGGSLGDWFFRRTGDIRKSRFYTMTLGFLGPIPFVFLLLFPNDLTTSALYLAIAMFLSEFVTAPIWAVSMDLAPHHSGTAAGIMNAGLAVAASVSPILIGWLLDITGIWNAGFVALIAVMAVGPLLAWFIRPDRPYLGESDPEPKLLGEVAEALSAR